MKKTIFLTVFIAVGSLLMMSSTNKREILPPWVAPSWADTIKNPLKGHIDAIDAGKTLYASYCVPCHGEKGRGDGIAAAGLNPKPADHTSIKTQSQTDGAIFWKITTGRPPMASYASVLTPLQRWQVIDYIRTLAKKTK